MLTPSYTFPDTQHADADGLLAISDRINADMAFSAHTQGIFPWPCNDYQILWWAPNPRTIIYTDKVHISKSLKKYIKHHPELKLTLDHNFNEVIDLCAHIHGDSWITTSIKSTYESLHLQQRAHSCELWSNERIIGGLYGVCIGNIFCGESMFSLEKNASKIVLIGLCHYLHQNNIKVLDTQFMTEHLRSMGAIEIDRTSYESYLDDHPNRLTYNWHSDISQDLHSIIR